MSRHILRLKDWFPSSGFARSVLILMTGTTLAQAIPVAVSPLLTRLYTPADFGVLALFVSITAFFGAVANARYEIAVVLPEREEEAVGIVVLAVIIALLAALLLLFAVSVFNQQITNALGVEAISRWLYFAPIAVALVGTHNALRHFAIRSKEFGAIAAANVHKAGAASGLQLLLGGLTAGPGGLIIGQLTSHVAGNARLLRNFMACTAGLQKTTAAHVKMVAMRYVQFPKYSLLGVIANNGAQNVTSIFISAAFSVATLGHYALVNRVIGLPSQLIGTAVSNAFISEAMDEKRRTGKAIGTFDRTLVSMLALAIPGFLVLYFVAEEIFAWFFGPEWRVAGQYAQILTILIGVRFVVSPLSPINHIFEKQGLALRFQLASLAITLTAFALSIWLELDFTAFLWLLSLSLTARYIIWLIVLRVIASGGFALRR